MHRCPCGPAHDRGLAVAGTRGGRCFAAPGALAERAAAPLAQLQRVVRFDAGVISLLPPGRDAHVSLARSGYDERICGHRGSPSLLEDVELMGLHPSRRPVRLCDLPVPPLEVPG
jgi:hypothetical protein